MSGFSISTYATSHATRNCKVLAIFIHPHPFNDNQLDEALAPTLSREGPFDAVHFVGFPRSLELLELLKTDTSASFKRLHQSIPNLAKSLRLIGIDGRGRLLVRNIHREIIDEPEIVTQTRQQSLQSIFLQRNGLIKANRGVHYTKPSGKHATQFLKTANVLEDSSVALQIAFWLFPYISDNEIKHIVVDTSGIDSVAFALAYERLTNNLQSTLPRIGSHSSYCGLAHLEVLDPDHTYFIISASTSGSLYESLIKRGAHASNIVTLYYLGSESTAAGAILADLTFREKHNENGLPCITNYSASDCPHCRQHSYAIPIVGDQFSTEPARVEEIEVLLNDFSDEQKKALDKLVGTGVFKVFRSSGGRDMEIYLDTEKLMFCSSFQSPEANNSAEELRKNWTRLVRRSMPVNLTRIIHTRYPGANRLADEAHKLLPSPISQHVKKLGSGELRKEQVKYDTAAVVVSPCLDESHELMGISRDLRLVQPGGNIAYIAPLFRASSQSERRRIESNLTFGEHGSQTFSLFHCIKLDLPACELQHSWQRELKSLEELVHWADTNDKDIPSSINDRINLLRDAPAAGLEENLFWPDVEGKPLKLSSDFTIIPNRNGQRQFSQADVFVIAASLFHQYRHGVKNKPRLIYLPYERTVISPESFQRFNDGILQASFLRAARNSEISYANCDFSVSERMHRFLVAEVDAATHGRGPALMEYVVSMLIGRLTLHKDLQHSFLLAVAKNEQLPLEIRLCAEFASGFRTILD